MEKENLIIQEINYIDPEVIDIFYQDKRVGNIIYDGFYWKTHPCDDDGKILWETPVFQYKGYDLAFFVDSKCSTNRNYALNESFERLLEHYNMIRRKEAEKTPDVLYIFTDNTDRTSGKNEIVDGWYKEKYGSNRKICYPNMTTAQIRGLDNSYPISTQRYYHGDLIGLKGRWDDDDYDDFSFVINNEVNHILNAITSGKYKELVFCSTIVNGKISNISFERTPKLFFFLKGMIEKITNKCDEINLPYRFI